MPGFEKEGCDWRVDGAYHIDGHDFIHYPFSKEIGLVAIMLFSDIPNCGGGTAIAEGSHLIASKLLIQAGNEGMSSKDLTKAVLQEKADFNIIELTGKAGDVILLHPLLLHARSTNLNVVSEHGVRFMCHPTIGLKDYLSYQKPFSEMTVLEKSMVLGAVLAQQGGGGSSGSEGGGGEGEVPLSTSDIELIVDHHIYTTHHYNGGISDVSGMSDDNGSDEIVLPDRLSRQLDSAVQLLNTITPSAVESSRTLPPPPPHLSLSDINSPYSDSSSYQGQPYRDYHTYNSAHIDMDKHTYIPPLPSLAHSDSAFSGSSSSPSTSSSGGPSSSEFECELYSRPTITPTITLSSTNTTTLRSTNTSYVPTPPLTERGNLTSRNQHKKVRFMDEALCIMSPEDEAMRNSMSTMNLVDSSGGGGSSKSTTGSSNYVSSTSGGSGKGGSVSMVDALGFVSFTNKKRKNLY